MYVDREGEISKSKRSPHLSLFLGGDCANSSLIAAEISCNVENLRRICYVHRVSRTRALCICIMQIAYRMRHFRANKHDYNVCIDKSFSLSLSMRETSERDKIIERIY